MKYSGCGISVKNKRDKKMCVVKYVCYVKSVDKSF